MSSCGGGSRFSMLGSAPWWNSLRRETWKEGETQTFAGSSNWYVTSFICFKILNGPIYLRLSFMLGSRSLRSCGEPGLLSRLVERMWATSPIGLNFLVPDSPLQMYMSSHTLSLLRIQRLNAGTIDGSSDHGGLVSKQALKWGEIS